MHLVDGWAWRRCAPTDLLLRQDMSDRRCIPRSSVGTTIPGAVLTIYAGQRPAHPGSHPSPRTQVRIQARAPRSAPKPAHPGPHPGPHTQVRIRACTPRSAFKPAHPGPHPSPRTQVRTPARAPRSASGPAHPGPHPSPHTPARAPRSAPQPAHPGAVLTMLLPLVFLSVRDAATTLETPFQLSAYPNNRLTVPRMHLVDRWARRRCAPTDAS